MYIGIDPGKSGAIVELTHDGKIHKHHKFSFDAEGLLDPIATGFILADISGRIGGGGVWLERALPMAMGAKHAFNYGRDFQTLVLCLLYSKLPYVLVEPSRWTKEICQGVDKNLKTKARSEVAFRRLMPTEVEKVPVTPKSKQMDDGVLEAALIAEFGRRQGMMHS